MEHMESPLINDINNQNEEIISSTKYDYHYKDHSYDLICNQTKTKIIFKCKEKNISIINEKNKNNNIAQMDEQYFINISKMKCYSGEYSINDLEKIDDIFNYYKKKGNKNGYLDKIYSHINALISKNKLKIEIKDKLILSFEFSLNDEIIPIEFELNAKNIGKKEIMEYFQDDFNEHIKEIKKLKEMIDKLKEKKENKKLEEQNKKKGNNDNLENYNNMDNNKDKKFYENNHSFNINIFLINFLLSLSMKLLVNKAMIDINNENEYDDYYKKSKEYFFGGFFSYL